MLPLSARARPPPVAAPRSCPERSRRVQAASFSLFPFLTSLLHCFSPAVNSFLLELCLRGEPHGGTKYPDRGVFRSGNLRVWWRRGERCHVLPVLETRQRGRFSSRSQICPQPGVHLCPFRFPGCLGQHPADLVSPSSDVHSLDCNHGGSPPIHLGRQPYPFPTYSQAAR